ncbi:vacuolar protein sorting-associated protein 54-like isoform X2 [Babylonia areolata]|uniref:vacuolar protein sorting-associated protein 54-like isoform X2 n=1 Tax=Babylonia areolata TaxID=304850 RepID=UPI003FD4F713
MSSLVDTRPVISPWKTCVVCRSGAGFKTPREFAQHLRDFHCSKEGGSFVCRYGMNGVCPSLPLEGVSDRDYDDHVSKDHIYCDTGGARKKTRVCELSQDGRSLDKAGGVSANTDPNIVQDQYKWTIHNASVNLPALLNDPRLVRRETDFFTKTWGQNFEKGEVLPSPFIPDVEPEHFEKYMRRVALRYRKHVRQKERINQQKNAAVDATASASQHLKQIEQHRAELDQIKLFMSTHFSLENPDIFNTVFPWTQIESGKTQPSSSTQPPSRQSSKLLQEKLSHYLDTVEVQIARQISTKSEAFFHAMTSHDELQDQLSHTLHTIKHLRDTIHRLDERMAKESLKIMRLTQTRANYVQLFNKLKIMSSIHETQPTIQRLLSDSEFIGALDLISTSQDVLAKDLGGIHSFRHLGSQLAEMERLIDKMLQADFSKYTSLELHRPVSDTVLLTDEERLVSILFGMLRQHKFNFVDVYREEAFTALKATVKQTIVEAVSAAEDVMDMEGSLADQMRLLDYPRWMTLLKDIFTNLLLILHRSKAFYGVALDVVGIASGRTKHPTSTAASDHSPLEEPEHLHVSVDDMDVMITEGEYDKTTASLRDMLNTICDYAHDRCVKVMTARAKDGFLERLSSSEFVNLSREVERFMADTESVCGRASVSLRGSLQSQANRFVTRFHEERKNKLSLILDNERWKQADVPAEFQALADHIASTGTCHTDHIASTGNLSVPERRPDTESRPTETLLVNGERYAVVGTVLMLVKMVMEYCQCVTDIPTAAPDLLSRLVDLLKMFNSRTCQLLIGAGARQLVGLKTISVRNLGLASRCLQLVVHYIPQVQTHFEAALPAKNHSMLKHFDKIVKDYQDHIEEICNKLVSIAENSLEGLLSKYEVKAPMPSQCFRSVCKQLAKLHEALLGVLPQQQVRELFVRMNTSFKRLLRQRLVVLGVTNDGSPQHGLVTSDLTFYAGSFVTLQGLEDLVHNMDDVWVR